MQYLKWTFYIIVKRPLKNGNLCSSSRKAKISTTGIYGIFRGLKFEPDAEIGHKVPFCKGLVKMTGCLGSIGKSENSMKEDLDGYR